MKSYVIASSHSQSCKETLGGVLMDDLIEEVIQRLKERQNSETTVTFDQQINPPDEQTFINHEKVILEDTSISFIADLYSMKNDNPWVAWILQGIKYGVRFFIKIDKQMVSFIPRMMVLDWPIIFVVGDKSPLIASRGRIISRGEIAAFPDNSILVKYYKQFLTDEAKNICRYKNITVKVRTEEDCIWLK